MGVIVIDFALRRYQKWVDSLRKVLVHAESTPRDIMSEQIYESMPVPSGVRDHIRRAQVYVHNRWIRIQERCRAGFAECQRQEAIMRQELEEDAREFYANRSPEQRLELGVECEFVE
jgi:hypothetical protein